MSVALGIIPARGGSKGVRHKNIRRLRGKPLIHYTIEAAKDACRLTRVVVSTDSEEIARCAREAGAEVPFLRPPDLATDHAPVFGVVAHALKWFEEKAGLQADYIVLLQPTTPLRDGEDIDRALALLEQSGARSLISVYDATHVHPSIMYVENHGRMKAFLPDAKMMRRQEFEQVYVRNGCLYMARRDYFVLSGRLTDDQPVGMVMPRWKSVNIDEELDFLLAEAFIERFGRQWDQQ